MTTDLTQLAKKYSTYQAGNTGIEDMQKSVLARKEKGVMNQEIARAVHREKLDRSSPDFKDTRVTSCSSVFMKNGQAVAMAFETGRKKQVEQIRSSERSSFAS